MNLLSRHHFSPGLDILSVFCPSLDAAEEEEEEFGINAMQDRLKILCLNLEFKILSGLVLWEGFSKSWHCNEENSYIWCWVLAWWYHHEQTSPINRQLLWMEEKCWLQSHGHTGDELLALLSSHFLIISSSSSTLVCCPIISLWQRFHILLLQIPKVQCHLLNRYVYIPKVYTVSIVYNSILIVHGATSIQFQQVILFR